MINRPYTRFDDSSHLSSKDLYALPIQLPPVDAQKQLGQKLKEACALSRSFHEAVAEQLALATKLSEGVLGEIFQGIRPITVRPLVGQVNAHWRWHRLAEVARLESGHTPSRRHPEWWGGDVPWLALPDIRKLHGKIAFETSECTNDAGLANSAARLLPVDTVCLCRDASIGFVTILGRPMATSQHFVNWICAREKLDPEFLLYAFMASHDYLRELGSGSVIKTIYMHTIESFHVCAPEIGEQQRIARVLRERLAAAESLANNLKERLAEMERLPQKLLTAAFGEAR